MTWLVTKLDRCSKTFWLEKRLSLFPGDVGATTNNDLDFEALI